MFGRDRPRSVYLFPAPVKVIGGSKSGYINAKGEFILPLIYDHAADFQENDLAIVRLLDRDGVINSSGYFIVKPKYETISPFSEARATVIDREGFKVIDESGKEITLKAYDFIDDFKEGRALVSDTNSQGKYLYGYLNRMGKEIIPLEYEAASDFVDGKAVVKLKEGSYALIGLTGKIVKNYSYAFVGDYGDGLLSFKYSMDGKFGFIDEEGRVIIEPQFSGVQPFRNNRAIINISDDYLNQYGLIDRSGQFKIKPVYNDLLNLGENRFALGKSNNPKKPYLGSTYAITDEEGHLLTGFIYNGITHFKEGLASAQNHRSTFFIDRTGKRVESLPLVEGSGTLSFDKTIIKAEVDFRLIYLNDNGELIWRQKTIIPLNSGKTVIEHKYKPNKDYLVYFPQITGMPEINQTLMELSGVKDVPSGIQLESNYVGDFNVPYQHKNLLVIEIVGYNYPFGAAHGMPVQKYVHIDLERGEVFQLKDLFIKNSHYVEEISKIIEDQIKSNEKYSYVFPDTYKGIRPGQPFFIDEAGLNIYFEPYEIAPFAAGFPTFTIPFEEIMTLINQKGRFWKTFH